MGNKCGNFHQKRVILTILAFYRFFPEILVNFSLYFLKKPLILANIGVGVKKNSWCRGGSQIRFAVGGVGFRAGVGGVEICPGVGGPICNHRRAHTYVYCPFRSILVFVILDVSSLNTQIQKNNPCKYLKKYWIVKNMCVIFSSLGFSTKYSFTLCIPLYGSFYFL